MKLKADLHLHSFYSPDSFLSPKKIIEVCHKKGINCLAITDHNEIKGALEVKKLAPFKVIVAEEIETKEGEIIGFFLKERIKPYLSPEETILEIKKQGGLVAIPHPFDYLRRNIIKKEALRRIIDQVDMIEIFNSGNIFNISNQKAEDLCRSYSKAPYAGSDAHTPFEIGSTSTELDDFNVSAEFLVNLKKAKFIKSKSPYWAHFFILLYKFYKIFKK